MRCNKCNKDKKKKRFNRNRTSKRGCSYECKKCILKRKRSRKGLVRRMFSGQKVRSKLREYNPPNYTKEELMQWVFSQPNFKELYLNWVNSGYEKDLIPSCDRLDDYEGYCLSRLRLVTWKDNQEKGFRDRKNGINNKVSKAVIRIDLVTKEEKTYYSMAGAAKKNNTHYTGISACCRGKIQTAGGYKWRYNEG